MSQPELDSLIVQHLADLDKTTLRIARLQGQLFEAMKEVTEDWCEKNGWYANFSYDQESHCLGECWLAPKGWHTADSEDEDAYDTWFRLGVGNDDTERRIEGEDFWFLTRLCGIGVGQAVFRFETGLKKGRAWKQAFAHLALLVEGTSFRTDAKPSLFQPIVLDPGALARAFEQEDLQTALEPYTNALGELAKAKPAFDDVVRQLRSGQVV